MNGRKNTFENKQYIKSQDLKLKQYAQANIKALRCNRLVLKKDEDKCCCGRTKSDHEDCKGADVGKWDVANDLLEMPTNAYGEMKLNGFRTLAGLHLKYVRASQTARVCDHLYHVMTKLWDFKIPELIISINGGAKKMIPLNNEQKSAFKKGLINVSKAASTWIITGGFNFGVPKLVGEAAKDHNVASQEKSFTVLGIGTWGAVHNRQDLVISVEKPEVTYNNVDGKFSLKGQAPLDPNHDAFILFDSGIEGVFGMEIKFRAEFEMFISRKAKCRAVQVIVEGGKKCIITANEALMQGIPVVVMKGSKRAADLICDTIESDENLKLDIINEGLQKNKEEWSIATDTEMDSLRGHLLSLYDFKQKNLIHIFSMSDFNKNLDRAILEAAFSGKIDGKELTDDEKLKLAMTFNRPDVAEECILDPSMSRNQLTDYREFIQIALIKNQWKFVNLFLARGTQVESFLTKSFLEKLYFGEESAKYINPNVFNIIRFLKDDASSSNPNQISTIGLIIRKLTQNLILNLYNERKKCSDCRSSTDIEEDLDNEMIPLDAKVLDFDKYCEPFVLEKRRMCSKGGCTPCQSQVISKQYVFTKHPPRNKAKERIYTEQDLFIWALLTQRWEMAKIFWENGKDHIGSALIASVICNSLGKIASKEGELDMMATLQGCQEEFETLAISVLTEAYGRDKIRTHLLLIRALPYWGRVTCMEIANRSQLINFLSHSACQTRLNSIWLGGMSMYTSTILFLLNLPFAFFTSKLLIFRSTRTDDYATTSRNVISIANSTETNPEELEADPSKINSGSDKISSSPVGEKIGRQKKEYLTKFRVKQQIAWQNVSYCQAVSLYYRAPITKFTMHIISYLLFLTIFSYTLLVELLPLSAVTMDSQRQMEYAVYVYILSFVLEEIRQSLAGTQIDTFKARLVDWISSLWNVYDLILYILFLIAVILRHITSIDFVYSRTIFSVTLSMFFLRFLQFYYANRSLGPKVISVSRMIKDIAFFLALYVVAIFAYGTFAQALLFSNSPINGFLLKNIVYMPYWESYGDLHLEYVEGTVPVNNVTATPNAIVIVGFALYMLFTNALLMNMLVAMFGMTFQKVEDNSNRIWAFNRYQLIEEFYYRPILPPPLNVFEIIWMVFRFCSYRTSEQNLLKKNDFVVNLCHDEDLRSAGFEQQCLEMILLDTPLLKLQGDNEQSSSIVVQRETKDTPSASSVESNLKVLTESWMTSVMESLNEMKREIKTVTESMHKMRRHQKREGSMTRSSSIMQEPNRIKAIRKVAPLDDNEM